MVIAGAGGHGHELKYCLIQEGIANSEIIFFDEDPSNKNLEEHPTLICGDEQLKEAFQKDPRFMLGVGNPIHREKLYHLLTNLGGIYTGIHGSSSLKEDIHQFQFDVFPFSFLGPKTRIGTGVLINTRASVHHESTVGEFSEIGPGAMLLGASKIGKKCRIGAGAVILPGVELGDEVIVGAGAVVTKSFFGKGMVIKGIPAK